MQKGFTLIELLVVVLKSRYANMRTVLRAAATAYEAYYLANGSYPASLADLDLEFVGDGASCAKLHGPELECVSLGDFYLRLFDSTLPGVSVTIHPKYASYRNGNASGYQYLFAAFFGRPARQFYCKTGGYATTEDRHCDGLERVQYNWHGDWYVL